jgi:excisionase family DNA binding protein
MSDLLTASQAAARLNISERTLRKLRQSGQIPYIALTDRLFRYTTEDCDEYVATRRRKEGQCPSVKILGRRTGCNVSDDSIGFMALRAKRKNATQKPARATGGGK